MRTVRLRFYEELSNYLPKDKYKVWFDFVLSDSITIRQVFLQLGVPGNEVDLVLVNGKSQGFDYCLQDGDRISVYPTFELFDISGVGKLRRHALRQTAFVCDVHLGRLCKYLRMLGLDTVYSNRYTEDELIAVALQENRIILSQSYQVIKHKGVTRAYWVRSPDPKEQLKDVLSNLDLFNSFSPLTRCLNCNYLLELVDKQKIQDRLQPKTAAYYREFFICPNCDQIFWKGSHYENMLDFISQLVAV